LTIGESYIIGQIYGVYQPVILEVGGSVDLIFVRGLVLSFKGDGHIEVNIPKKRWQGSLHIKLSSRWNTMRSL